MKSTAFVFFFFINMVHDCKNTNNYISCRYLNRFQFYKSFFSYTQLLTFLQQNLLLFCFTFARFKWASLCPFQIPVRIPKLPRSFRHLLQISTKLFKNCPQTLPHYFEMTQGENSWFESLPLTRLKSRHGFCCFAGFNEM